MKKTMRFLSIAALAFMGAIIIGCSKENNVPQQGNVVKLTATVDLDGGATKALTSDGVKTFAVGDQIAVVYKNTSSETVKAVSEALTAGDITGSGKTANFTVTLTDPDNTQNVTYIYPASIANADGSINYDALNSQDGLLTSLANNLDLATYTGAWSGTSLPTATLDNPLAILAITLKNSDGSEEITDNTTSMTFSDGTNSYTVTRAAAAGPIYVAIRPTASADIEITATGGPLLYSKNLSTKTFAANNGYNVTWRMTRIGINLAGVTENTTAIDGDIITGTLDVEHYPVKISIADGATVTLDNVAINGVTDGADDWSESTVPWAGIRCEGDATIILADGTTNIVKGFYEEFPGIWIRENYTLTINGTGSLVASSNGHGAGIGGGRITTFGNIRIEGGNITAIGGDGCAGIGAGGWGSGNITITGGYINATGYKGGSGIGSGASDDATCGNITISGGTIIASCTESGAGIGAGYGGTCGDILIQGGNITATACTNETGDGAGIGAGDGGTCGDITISGGTITATGYDGAGIGIAWDAVCGDIYISGGTIQATGSKNGAGIGCSSTYSRMGTCGTIVITSDVTQVTATKGNASTHSIGFGRVGAYPINCGAVTIGGIVYWNGSEYENDGNTYLATSPFIYPAP